MRGRYEVITEGSDGAERLCQMLLEPAADHFAGEYFRGSEQDKVGIERTWHLDDGRVVNLSFWAFKMDGDEDPGVAYEISASVSRPRDEKMWWPEIYWGNPENDEYSEYDDEEEGGVATIGGEVDEDEDEEAGSLGTGAVQEVKIFRINTENYKVEKEIDYEYFNEDGDPIDMVSLRTRAIEQKMLSENMEEDTFLQIEDASMALSFSEQDIVEMRGIITRLGYQPPRHNSLHVIGARVRRVARLLRFASATNNLIAFDWQPDEEDEVEVPEAAEPAA